MDIILIEEIKIDLQNQCALKMFKNSPFPIFLISFDNLSKTLHNDPEGEIYDEIDIIQDYFFIKTMIN